MLFRSNLGTRQEGREYGANVVHAAHNTQDVLRCAREQINHGKYPPSILYGNGTAGKQIADILANQELVIQKRFYEL